MANKRVHQGILLVIGSSLPPTEVYFSGANLPKIPIIFPNSPPLNKKGGPGLPTPPFPFVRLTRELNSDQLLPRRRCLEAYILLALILMSDHGYSSLGI